MTALRLITAPVDAPVSLDEMKEHLRVETDAEDDLITAYRDAAVAHLDGWRGILGMALMAQVWELTLDEFPGDEIRLPLGPVINIVSVKYDDEDGDETTIDAAEYDLDANDNPAWLLPVDSWPTTLDGINAVRVRFTAGHATAAEVPEPIKQAIRLIVGNWYQNREEVVVGSTVAKLPNAADVLLAPYRVYL